MNSSSFEMHVTSDMRYLASVFFSTNLLVVPLVVGRVSVTKYDEYSTDRKRIIQRTTPSSAAFHVTST